MSRFQRKSRKERDVTGWLLGATVVVLATLDLYVWAALPNVPNPVSHLLGTETAQAGSVHHAATKGPPFH